MDGHHDGPGHEEPFPEPAALGRGWGVRLPFGIFLTPVCPGVDPVEKAQDGPDGQTASDSEPAQSGLLLQGLKTASREHQAGPAEQDSRAADVRI